nr:transporter substrate-binding domain-containing protein [Bacteriovorax sp. HI3]
MRSYLFSLTFISLFFSSAVNAEPIKLCYEDVVVFPWITGDKQGLALSEMIYIEKKLNIRFKYVRLPWKRCMLEAQSGKVDALIAASFTSERTKWGVYPTKNNGQLDTSLKLHSDSYIVYVRNDSAIRWEDGKFVNLGSNQVGVQLGYSVGNDLLEAGYPVYSTSSTAAELLEALQKKVVNVAVLQHMPSIKTLNEKPALGKGITAMPQPFKEMDQYLLFTKTFYAHNKDLTHKIWNTIPQARESGEYQKLKKTLLGSPKID